MSWTDPADLRRQLQRHWNSGRVLRAAVNGGSEFPLRLTLLKPTSKELGERFGEVRDWIAALASVKQLAIEWRAFRHPQLGEQRVPEAIRVNTVQDAAQLIGESAALRRYVDIVEATRRCEPSLLPWIERRPLKALELTDAWELLLRVVAWLKANPRPGIYLRQAVIPGVDSKFIETYRAPLAELLDVALPVDPTARSQGPAAGFNNRYGFLDKPLRIRFRALDPAVAMLTASPDADIQLDLETFARLELPVRSVFITENEVNYLAFPSKRKSVVIFGSGYGWEWLNRAQWVTRAELVYWGDLDTHGFAILDRLRRFAPAARSVLMDRSTLISHRAHWGKEPSPTRVDLPNLTGDEALLYDLLRGDAVGERVRLEQEHIGFDWVTRELSHWT